MATGAFGPARTTVQVTSVGRSRGAKFQRSLSRYLAQRAELQQRVDDLGRQLATARPFDRDALSVWPELTVAQKRRALRLVIGHITVLPSPRRGRGQRELIAQRVEIGWTQ